MTDRAGLEQKVMAKRRRAELEAAVLAKREAAAPDLAEAPKQASIADRALRQGGLAARYLAEGAGALPMLAADAPNNLINLGLQGYGAATGTEPNRLTLPSEIYKQALSPLPHPETTAEKVFANPSRAVASLASLGGGPLSNAATSIGSQIGPAISGGLGVSAAEQYTDNPLLQMAAGVAGAGAYALPRAIGRGAVNQLDLVLPGGAERIAQKFHNKILKPDDIALLREALSKAEPIVPGSIPTAAEAVAGMPGGSPIQSAQRVIAAAPGGPSSDFGSRLLSQQQARSSVVQAIAGTDDDLAAAIAKRSASSAPFYEAVKTSRAKVDATPVMFAIKKAVAENPKNTAVTAPLKRIEESLYAAKGLETRPQALKSLADEIKRMIASKKVDGQAEFDVKVLSEIKDVLNSQIGAADKNYVAARGIFKKLSAPVNRMNAARYLQEKLVPPTGQESPGTFLRALDDVPGLFKKSTGFNRYRNLEDVFTRQQVANLRAVALDLERKLAAMRPLQKTNLGDAVNFASEAPVHAPRLLSRPVAVANAALSSLGRNVEPKVYEALARQYLNPAELAKALQDAPRKAGAGAFVIPPIATVEGK